MDAVSVPLPRPQPWKLTGAGAQSALELCRALARQGKAEEVLAFLVGNMDLVKPRIREFSPLFCEAVDRRAKEDPVRYGPIKIKRLKRLFD